MEQGLDEAYKKVQKVKLILTFILLWISWMLPSTVVIGILTIPLSIPVEVFWTCLGVLIGGSALVLIIVMTWINKYYESFRFALKDQEVFIREGVITKTERHIPYGRIQNLNINKGFFQRKYGISTLKIETAGFTARAGSTYGSAEGIIPGIKKPEEVIDQIRSKLGHKKEGLAEEILVEERAPTELKMLKEINETLKAIRTLLENKK